MKSLIRILFAVTILFAIGCSNAAEEAARRKQENLESTKDAMNYLFESSWRSYVSAMTEGTDEEKEIAKRSLLEVPDVKKQIADVANDPETKPEEKSLAEALLKEESDSE